MGGWRCLYLKGQAGMCMSKRFATISYCLAEHEKYGLSRVSEERSATNCASAIDVDGFKVGRNLSRLDIHDGVSVGT